MKRFAKSGAVLGASLLALGATTAPIFAQDYPSRDIEMIIPFGVGGGSDVLARTIASVIGEKELLPVQILPENRPGGSGAVGYGYVGQQQGNDHLIATVSVSFFTTPLLGASPVSYEDFTPLAAISYSPYVLAVPTSSPYESVDDLAEVDRLTTATVGVVSDAALLADMLTDSAGVQIDAVPFDGEGEALAAILGGHVDIVFMNPSELLAQTEAGTLRPLAVSSAERVEAFPDVPTFTELGHDIEHVQLRGLVMPGGVSEEVVDYWEGILEEVATSDEWREQYIETYYDSPAYLNSEEFAALIEQTNDRYRAIMEEQGLI
ncbi:Bug family tripartite tricarboxylate transporter substrate binding protein [Pelagibacterium luteolum]|uniref:Putative tricarboxylic transport membrane protein n=1 Tax=Pelagibacterium luteolum TaxID=440168 RepID=A0A1G7WRF8_9HYPH|nr:tripartite tricarboxylate transporter substrate binding protein [Pelagibacterium luteolum]SDG74468.1 putative tricarboxylic transport membrane protein [Pelagibacterium luteolum]